MLHCHVFRLAEGKTVCVHVLAVSSQHLRYCFVTVSHQREVTGDSYTDSSSLVAFGQHESALRIICLNIGKDSRQIPQKLNSRVRRSHRKMTTYGQHYSQNLCEV